MEKSNVEKLKDALVYAPVGAFGFVKDNAPTFFSMFVSRGKRDVTKSAASAEEKISSTKEHGQFVAMGTPIAKTKAQQLAQEAKSKGEDLAATSIDLIANALGLVENAIRGVAAIVADDKATDSSKPQTTATPSQSTATHETTEAPLEPVVEPEASASEEEFFVAPEDSTPSNSSALWSPSNADAHVTDDALARAEGDFIAEPASPSLPTNIKAIYERLSAPEIIDQLDTFQPDDLEGIREYESGFRNRQTIIHAIDYRLGDN